jgi:hypothetical protein
MANAPPLDLARLPTLTEVVDLDAAASEPAAQHATEPLPSTTPMAVEPQTVASASAAAHGRDFLLKAGAANQFRTEPAIPLAPSTPPATAASAASDALISDAPRNTPAEAVPAAMPDWVKKVVTDAVDEAMAEAMVYLLPHITKHVQKRLEEAAKNPPTKS